MSIMRDSWNLGRLISQKCIRKKQKIPDPTVEFGKIFPNSLDRAKGDKKKETILMKSLLCFCYGVRYPGLGYEYAEKESIDALIEGPNSHRRSLFFHQESRIIS